MHSKRQATVLLVEDDPGHARLIEKNLRRSGATNEIFRLSDGRQALDFLYSLGEFENRKLPTPLLIVLDLNLPEIDGYAVLSSIKTDEALRRTPVVILTSTDDPREAARCYDIGCNAFITKPVDYDEFAKTISSLGQFLSVINIPEEE